MENAVPFWRRSALPPLHGAFLAPPARRLRLLDLTSGEAQADEAVAVARKAPAPVRGPAPPAEAAPGAAAKHAVVALCRA